LILGRPDLIQITSLLTQYCFSGCLWQPFSLPGMDRKNRIPGGVHERLVDADALPRLTEAPPVSAAYCLEKTGRPTHVEPGLYYHFPFAS